jgi:hypothetical protein
VWIRTLIEIIIGKQGKKGERRKGTKERIGANKGRES